MVTRPGRLEGKVAVARPDLWTSRVDPKWGDLIPHVKFHERRPPDQAGS